ncbi:MAG: NosD domain-containing protein [Bacillota bacterium]
MRKSLIILIITGLVLGFTSVGTVLAATPITLGDVGWSQPVGTWDQATRTASLMKDLNAQIQIKSDGITLEGNGHVITGNGTGDGIYLLMRNGVTIKNLKIKKFTNGIQMRLSNGNTVTGVTALKNTRGIWVINSRNNDIENNVLDGNNYQGLLIQAGIGNKVAGNSACGNIFGLYLMGSSGNTVTGNTASNEGCGIWLMGCGYNTVADNTANNNSVFGIHMQGSTDNIVERNTVSDNVGGVRLMGCQKNTIANNTAVNSGTGINLQGSPNNIISGNVLEKNKYYGVYFINAGGNTVNENTITENGCGIHIWNSYNNKVYNNNFINNTTQATAGIGSGNVFNLEKPVGGNYWSNWTSPDADGDGFVDNPYVFVRPNRMCYGQDNLPWTRRDGWQLDGIQPSTTVLLSGIPGQNGWFISDVEVTLTAADGEGGSGVARTEYSFNGTDWVVYSGPFTITDEGTTTFRYRSVDNSGNVEEVREQAAKIDKTPPQITINTPLDGSELLLNQNVPADWSATDEISGVASAAGTVPSGVAVDTAITSAKEFTVTAVDNAGNQAAKTVNYYVRYAYSGVLPPIDNDGGSTFKLGRCIPVKFRLQDADGNYATKATVRLYLAKVVEGVPGDEIEAVSNSQAVDDNSFRYSTDENQYLFNLETKDLSVGTWQLRIALDDGSSKYVTISLWDK